MDNEEKAMKIINNLPFQIDDKVFVEDSYVADKIYVGLTGIVQDIYFSSTGVIHYKIKFHLSNKASKHYLSDVIWFPEYLLKRRFKS